MGTESSLSHLLFHTEQHIHVIFQIYNTFQLLNGWLKLVDKQSHVLLALWYLATCLLPKKYIEGVLEYLFFLFS